MATTKFDFRFPDELIARLDAWRKDQPFPPSRTEVLKGLLERFLAEQERQKSRATKNRLASSDLVD